MSTLYTTVCVFHEHITVHYSVQGSQGMHGGRGHFLGKDNSCESTLAIKMSYLSLHGICYEYIESINELAIQLLNLLFT